MGILDGVHRKNVALAVLGFTTVALAIALGVTVSKFNHLQAVVNHPSEQVHTVGGSSTNGSSHGGHDIHHVDTGTPFEPQDEYDQGGDDDEVVFLSAPQNERPGNADSVARTTETIDLSLATITCPVGAASSQAFTAAELVNAAALGITVSTATQLCTLVRLNNPLGDGLPENTFIQPLGRTYSGNPWEKTRGEFVQQVAFDCTAGTSCTIDLTLIEAVAAGSKYQLSTFFAPTQYTKKSVIARFLEQTTFGQTTADITALDAAEPSTDLNTLKASPALAAWVTNQQDATAQPVWSHRAFWRTNVNARFEHEGPMGRLFFPCERGSRWRRMAFSDKDDEKTLVVSTSGTTKLFSIDGKVRTAYDPPLYGIIASGVITEVWYPDGDYRICEVLYDRFTGLSTVNVKHPDHTDCITLVGRRVDGHYYSNLPVQVHAGSTDVTINIPFASAQQIDLEHAFPPPLVPNELNSPIRPEIILTQDLTDDICFELRGGRGDECTQTGTENCVLVKCRQPPSGCFNVASRMLITGDGECCPGPCFAVDSLGQKCDAYGNSKNIIATWNEEVYMYDPRRYLFENTFENPKADGGGEIQNDFRNPLGDEWTATCANPNRNFVNENSCFLSTNPKACSYRPTQVEVTGDDPYSWFDVTLDALKNVYQATGAGSGGNTVYLYAIDGLRVEDDVTVTPPCSRGRHRFVIQPCTSNVRVGLEPATYEVFERLLPWRDNWNTNPYFMDWWRGTNTDPCDPLDINEVGFEVYNTNMDGTCFKHVHPEHLNVFDFTFWTVQHPGNSDTRNPIKEFHEAGQAILTFPSWHEMDRWHTARRSAKPGDMRLGSRFDFYRLPQGIRRLDVAGALGVQLDFNEHEQSVEGPFMVCGSPYEVQNDPFQGGNSYAGTFDAATSFYQTTRATWLKASARITWFVAAMTAGGQLRQRIAWALAQIFAISPDAINRGDEISEAFMVYYDIFLRHAFGNYRDVMKEVSFSPLMAEMLTYYGGRSTAIVLEDEGNIEFADENYAREVMQLFSLGLYRLNKDGTQMLDGSGEGIRVYTNDDIEEYARAWTGFIRQERRGNIEEEARQNQIDPMQIFGPWRDRLPKMGLFRAYVGDGFPLCSDLVSKHFLQKGATYRLLDSYDPELHMDPVEWRTDGTAIRLTIDPSSQLYAKISAVAPQLKIVLDATVPCTLAECDVDTVRVIKVGNYFYEYLRQPCVQYAYYSGGQAIAKRTSGAAVMCGQPQVETATTACCDAANTWNEKYFGERTLLATAAARCTTLCNIATRPDCTANECLDDNYYWTTETCMVKAKINPTSGKVYVVHEPNGVAEADVASIVQPHTQTYFRVDWTCGDPATCGLSACTIHPLCTVTADGMCLCQTTVTEEAVFDFATPPSRQQVLDSLKVGAFQPDGVTPTVLTSDPTVSVYYGDTAYSTATIFQVVDDYGRTVLRKNVRSLVTITGTSWAFRNPVHFINLADPEPRDAYYETDAVLDHYFCHPNIGPFVAYRFAQRFGVSNPSPRYTEVIANAFVTGTYTFTDGTTSVNYGSGNYGDLASTFAAVVLDREARDFILDMDMSYGSVKEPIMKITGLLRSLGFVMNPLYRWAEFQYDIGEIIGQMAHEIPSVFSFFLPEFSASGPVSQGSLVAPEAQVLTAPRIIDTVNGILSALRYGLNNCRSGIGPTEGNPGRFCSEAIIGTKLGVGGFGFTPASTATAMEEVATLMTAGRLNPEKRAKIPALYDSTQADYLIKWQMLISATPEFHTTGIPQTTGALRPEKPAPTPSAQPYKAMVYIFLSGAFDSWNTLVPHTCTTTNAAGKTPREQYEDERSSLRFLDSERSRIINAAGQPCSQFVVHPTMEFLERNYNAGDLAFFANIGQIDTPVTKDDYNRLTRSQLFAHNSMQQENFRIDPWDTTTGTGLLGRMCDRLLSKGYKAQPTTVLTSTVATEGVPGAGVPPLVVGLNGVESFAPKRWTEDIDLNDHWAEMNNETEAHSSAMGETWSINFKRAVEDSTELKTAIDSVTLTQNYPNGEGPTRNMIRTVKTLASMILTRSDRGVDRDVFFARIGGWDHHAKMKTNLQTYYNGLNQALSIFESELKAQGLWDSVTVAVVSEFARTLTANSGDGSDHAWGGHYYLFGGSVSGGKIHGAYPTDITQDGPLNIGRGRIIPTHSWESMLTGPLQWMGLDTDADLDYCMPNRLNTGAPAIPANDVFV